jgi:hypothetical protein
VQLPESAATHLPPIPSRKIHHPRGALSIGFAVLVCALAVGACGSSSKPGQSTPGKGQFLAFSECMRTHGVSNFPDPSPGGGIQIRIGSGLNPFSPAFKAAQSTCRKLLPGGGPGAQGPPSAQATKQMLTISKCMRAHGVTGFPDPTTTPPSGPGGFSQVIGHDGLFLAVPDTINADSPVFKQAGVACHFGGP